MNFIPQREEDSTRIDEMIKALKDIRKERGVPGHSIPADKFDQNFLEKQRSVIKSSYVAIRNLRALLQCHPAVTEMDMGNETDEKDICLY